MSPDPEISPSQRYREGAPRLPEEPFALDALVPGRGPLELDIGFGRGLSLFERIEKAPGSRLVGLESKAKYVYRVHRRLARLQLHPRCRVFVGDARDVLRRAGPEGCVARAYVHFPDPWWKKRHTKRRLITRSFVDELARLLEPGGTLFIQTDVAARADAYHTLISSHETFALQGDAGGYVRENPFGARSNRERRAENEGLPVYRILAIRT